MSRAPQAFRIDPPPDEAPKARRAPRAAKMTAVISAAAEDPFDLESLSSEDASLAVAPRRRGLRFGAIFLSALGVLISLAVGLWADRLVRDLFARSEWLGWLALAMAAIAALALVVVVLREAAGIMRLGSVERLRADAAEAIETDNPRQARSVLDRVTALMSGRPDTAAGRRALDELRGDIVDGANLVRLAEIELMTELDRRATTMVLDASKRVSMVTAVSPRALVDIAYVVFESARLVRRLAELYGGRPGTLGFFRLARSVLAHLAVTGSLAAGDSFVQQIVGHGLAARLSAKLGEGVVNGMMTARIGLATIDTVRPLPFFALKRPGLSEFLSTLTSLTRAQKPDDAS